MITKEDAYNRIQALVIRFGEQIESYKQLEYNETLTRRDFIDPFFKALGWDVDNSQGYAEAYREVIHEDRVKVGKATKAPDYSFRLPGGKRLFFVEAKKPSITIKDDISVAYQIRRYGWSAKLPICIITDFEEFAVYDGTKKPNLTDKSGVARIKYINFQNYLNEFEYLWDTFSKERVLKGSFDKYVQSDTIKKGTATVDKEFLTSLDKWRQYLAITISLKNVDLYEDEINYAVQLIINRLIFLRIAEDRGVEQYGQLKNSVNQKGESYQNLFYNFRKADEKYNSGLFDFKKDVISEKLQIDNKVIKTIVNEMYYPESPYEFSVISVEILGSAYEQFLGKVIRITPAHHAKIEDKPEVRKAGGVYYTPQYIVDYIVKNTVGKLIDGKTPKQIEKIKIADPACGSGSFLIGAYQYLLDYHKNYYTENGTKIGKKESPTTPEGDLTSAEKKKILLNNIYGVDIDVNAVEVTKLSLLLKCMEGETETSIAQQQKLWHERILPTLDDNIKSGNSLIDTDFYDNQLDFGYEKKIKPFSWQKSFPSVFKQGGFDIVIGNPPYGADFIEEEKNYVLLKFKNQNYQLDSYLIFLEQSFKTLLKREGIFGMIIPNPWLTNLLQKNLRRYIFENCVVNEIVHFRQAVFPKVTVDTEIVILTNDKEKNNIIKITVVEKGNSLLHDNHSIITHKQKEWIIANGDVVNIFLSESDKILIKKILNGTKPLEEYFIINVGIKPYQVGKGKPKQTKKDVEERVFDSDNKENSLFRKYLRGSDINRYSTRPHKERYIKYGDWLAEPRPAANFDASIKIFIRQTGDSLIGTIDTKQYLCLNNMHVLVPKETSKTDVRYFLAIINSKLMNWYYQNLNPERGEALAEVKKSNVARLPIKIADEITQNVIIKYSDQLLKLNDEKASVKLESKAISLQSKIIYCEEKIDQLIYKLYDIPIEEINIIENNL